LRGSPAGIGCQTNVVPGLPSSFFPSVFWARSICQSPPLLQNNVRKRYPFLSVYCGKGQPRKPRRRWVRTTNSGHAHRVYPNLAQNLLVRGPNQLWMADITYIALLSGFVYLAVILDRFARRVMGYALSRNIDTALCLEALRMALALRRPPKGIVHHSDRGVQYASCDYVNELFANGFRIRMARKGNPYDNAAAESFIKILKAEEVYLWEYRTMDNVQNRLPHFIEDVYNRKRLHSALGYVPAMEFEEMFNQTKSCPATLTASV